MKNKNKEKIHFINDTSTAKDDDQHLTAVTFIVNISNTNDIKPEAKETKHLLLFFFYFLYRT